MSPTKYPLLCFFYICFSSLVFSQKKTCLLETHLQNIEEHFNIAFNYKSDLINTSYKWSCNFNKRATLKEHIDALEREFPLKFTLMTSNKIVIYPRTIRLFAFYDRNTRFPINDLIIRDTKTNTIWISNSKGQVFFEGQIPETISITHLNYHKKILKTSHIKNNRIYLEEKIRALNPLFIYPYFASGIYKSKTGHFFIKSKEIPALAGHTSQDVIKNLEHIPYVISNSESVSDLIIKGSTQDQNLFVWNDIKVYQTYHFFGLISAFNENLIENISLYDNATPGRYGNSTSGVIRLDNSETFSKTLHAGIGLNFLSADIYAKIPIRKNAEFQFSARKSFTSYWGSPTFLNYSKKVYQASNVNTYNPDNSNLKSDDHFKFYDIQVHYKQQFRKNTTLKLHALHLHNHLTYTESDALNENSKESQLGQKNEAISLQLSHKFSRRNTLLFSTNYSNHQLDGGNFLLSRDISSFEKNSIENYETNLQFQSQPKLKGFNYNIGASGEYIITKNSTTNFNLFYINKYRQRSTIYGVYGTLNYNSKTFKSGLDLRQVYYRFLNRLQTEPRFHITYSPSPKLDILLKGEQKTQNISQIIDLENNFLGIEKRRWYMTNDSIAPLQKSKQLEFSLIYKNKKHFANAGIYIKRVKGITTNNQGFQNLNQFDNLFGSYTIKGGAFHYNFKSKHTNAWISYNNSINTYHFNRHAPKTFYNSNDIRHRIISGINIKHNCFNLALGVEYFTGKPYTAINKTHPIIEGAFNRINYLTPNSARLSDYLRIDCSVSYHIKTPNRLVYQFTLGLINITDRANLLNRYYTLSEDKTAIEILDKYGLRFTPNIALNIKI